MRIHSPNNSSSTALLSYAVCRRAVNSVRVTDLSVNKLGSDPHPSTLPIGEGISSDEISSTI